MDDRLAYDNSIMNLRESSSLLSDPHFYLENQRQISLRHFRRLKRLQAEKSNAQLGSMEEHELAVQMAIARLEEDLTVLASQIDQLWSISSKKRSDWRLSLPLLAVPLIAFGNWISLPRSQVIGAAAAAFALLSAQTARREGAPRIYELLHEDITWLKRTVATGRTSAESWDEDILRQRWWKLLAYM